MLKLLSWLMEWLAFSDKHPTIYAICNNFRFVVVLLIILIIRILSTLWFADVASAALAYRGSPSHSTHSTAHSTVDISRAASGSLDVLLMLENIPERKNWFYSPLVKTFVLFLKPLPIFRLHSLNHRRTSIPRANRGDLVAARAVRRAINWLRLHVAALFVVQLRVHVDVDGHPHAK